MLFTTQFKNVGSPLAARIHTLQAIEGELDVPSAQLLCPKPQNGNQIRLGGPSFLGCVVRFETIF